MGIKRKLIFQRSLQALDRWIAGSLRRSRRKITLISLLSTYLLKTHAEGVDKMSHELVIRKAESQSVAFHLSFRPSSLHGGRKAICANNSTLCEPVRVVPVNFCDARREF